MEWYWWVLIGIAVLILVARFNALGDFVEALIDALD